MSTRQKLLEETEQRPAEQPDTTAVHEHITRLFGDARKLLDAAGPVTSRVLSSDSEGFLGKQRQIGGQ